MPKVHFVKKARKDNPVVKKGESYYWWEFRFAGVRYSRTYPRPSQLTQSEFYGTYYSIQETLEDALNAALDVTTVEEAIDNAKNDLECLRDETQDKLDNMPDQLQDSDTGQLLQERIEGCDEFISNLESIDIPESPGDSNEENNEYNLAVVSLIVGPWPVRRWAVVDCDTGKLVRQSYDDIETAREVLQDELHDLGEDIDDDSILENLKQEVRDADPGI